MQRTTALMLFLTGLVFSGCTPYWTGARMQKDIEQLQTEQEALTRNLKEKEAELTEMISSARADVDQLNRVIKDAADLLARNSADFGAEMEMMRQELQSMRGESEQLSFRMQKFEQDLQSFKEDVDLRFADGGGGNLPDDANELFKVAAQKFEEGDARTARKAFEKFVKKFGADRRADEAKFFIGETYFQQTQFPSAIFEYQKILKDHPKSDRLDDATFRIGESFAKMGKCKEAQVFFETVVKDFKGSKFSASAESELKRLGKCK